MASHLTPSAEELDENIQQLAKFIQTEQTARNAVCPVNMLSNEILFAVFMYCQAPQDNKYEYGRWTPAHVCRRWRRLTLQRPWYWRYITVSKKTSIECVEWLLERSINAPLVVHVTLEIFIEDLEQRCMDVSALNRVLDEVPRIHTLTINSNRYVSNYIMGRLHGPAPMLSTLCVFALGFNAHLSTPDRGILNLQDSGSKPFKNTLRQLNLALTGVPTMSSLRDALGGLPNLQYLSFWVARIHVARELFVNEPLVLPQLRLLRLTASASACTFFLHALSIPPSCQLAVDWLADRRMIVEDGAPLGRALARHLWGGDPGAGDAPLVKLDSDHRIKDELDRKLSLAVWRGTSLGELALSAYELDPTFVVAMETTDYRPESLLHALPILSKTRCLVLGDTYNVCAPGVEFTELDGVEEIAIRHDDAESSHLLLRLLQRRVHQESPSLLFPRLRTLYFSWIIFDEKWTHEPHAEDKPLPRNVAPLHGRAKLSLACLKTALERRKADGLPAVSLVLTSPVGLQPCALRTLAGVVETIKLDGAIVDLSADDAAVAAPTETTTVKESEMAGDGVSDDSTGKVASDEEPLATLVLTHEAEDDADVVGEGLEGDGEEEVDENTEKDV